MNYVRLGTLLKEELRARNMTKKELHDLSGIPTKHIKQIITGFRKMTNSNAEKLSKALNVPKEYFFNKEKK